MALFFAASFFVNGIVLPYYPVFLADRGLGAEEIALVVGMPFMLRIVSMPVVTAFADRVPDRRIVMVVLTVILTLASLVVGVITDLTAIALVSVAMLVVSYCHGPLADTIALSMERRGMLDYGKVRLWGSASFILANIVGGIVLDHYGAPVLYPLIVFGFTLAAVATLLIPPPGPLPRTESAVSLTILRKPAFLFVLLGGAFIQSSHAALYGFATITWQGRGYNEVLIGGFWAIGVIAEIVLFGYAGRIPTRIRPTTLMMIGGIVGVARWALFTIDLGAVLTALVQIGHAGSFAIAHIGIMRFIRERVPDERAASAQGNYVIMVGLAMSAATFVAGQLWVRIGDDSFAAMSVFAGIGVVILALTRSRASRLPTLAGGGAQTA